MIYILLSIICLYLGFRLGIWGCKEAILKKINDMGSDEVKKQSFEDRLKILIEKKKAREVE